MTATLPTTDVTDHGNKPGEGPLRPGGQPGQPSQDEQNLPSTMSPIRKAQEPALTMVRDLEGGAERVRDKGRTYLPQNPGEDGENYANRLNRSVFFNAFGETVEGLTGLVFYKDPVLSGDVPDETKAHWENIDLAGTHGDVFAAELFQDAFTAGHAAILVDFPKTDDEEPLTMADEQTRGIRPYWLPIRKDDILSWRTTVEDGRTILTQVVLRERQYVPEGAFGEEEQTRYRVLFRRVTKGTNGSIGVEVGWRLLEITEAKTLIKHGEGVYANQTEIPLAEVITSGQRGIFDSQPPLLDLAYLNIAHYQQRSDYGHSMHMTCVPVLYMFGIETKDEDGNAIVVGPNSAVMSTNPEAEVGYASHDGKALGQCRLALEDLKSEMGTLGIAMLAPQKRVAETAEAKRLDKATSDSKLGKAARGLQDAIERALQFHANYLLKEDGGSIEINRDFEGLLLDAPVMMAYAKLIKAGFPPRVVLEALQKGGRIPADADLDELEMEWMAATAVRAETEENERQ